MIEQRKSRAGRNVRQYRLDDLLWIAYWKRQRGDHDAGLRRAARDGTERLRRGFCGSHAIRVAERLLTSLADRLPCHRADRLSRAKEPQ